MRALMATTTVEKLIRTAPTAGLSTMPHGARTPAARGIAMMLWPVAHYRFWTILRYVACAAKRTAARGSLRTSTTSAVSAATSVPVPTTI